MVLPNLRVASAVRLHGYKSLAAVAAIAVSACAGSGEGLDESGRPIGENPGTPPPGGAVDFALLQSTILTPLCTTCHAGGAAPLGLRLEPGVSYAMLVNVASVEVPALLRVSPGGPGSSYLVQKIEGRAAVGARMPLGGPPLPQTSIDNVRQWISQGAPPPVSPLLARPQPLKILATAPADGEEAMAGLSTLLVVFDREIDTSLVNTSTFALIGGSGKDAVDAGSERDVALASIRVPSGNPTSVWLRTRSPLAAGVYELRVRANGAAALADIGGNVLDGDGDGIAGGDFRISFRVTEGTP